MGHFPAVLKELNNPGSLKHIGGVWNFMQPLCEKFSGDEMDIVGWISRRDQKIPRENVCCECFELYARGLAWKPSWTRD
jgi:hypothetical protein